MSEVSEHDKKIESGGRYLCFTLGREKFAIPLLHVKEVIANVETTSIPQSPAYFKGIMNLRGQVISVIDLLLKLKVEKGEPNNEKTIIILDFAPLCLGVVVDSVDSVVAFDSSAITNPPDVESAVNHDFIKGIARTDKSLTVILDLKSALKAEDYKTIKNQKQKVA